MEHRAIRLSCMAEAGVTFTNNFVQGNDSDTTGMYGAARMRWMHDGDNPVSTYRKRFSFSTSNITSPKDMPCNPPPRFALASIRC